MTATEPGGTPRYVAADGTVDVRHITHDLRGPLNAILGFARLLHDGKVGTLDARQLECAADVLEAGKALLAVVERFEREGARRP